MKKLIPICLIAAITALVCGCTDVFASIVDMPVSFQSGQMPEPVSYRKLTGRSYNEMWRIAYASEQAQSCTVSDSSESDIPIRDSLSYSHLQE